MPAGEPCTVESPLIGELGNSVPQASPGFKHLCGIGEETDGEALLQLCTPTLRARTEGVWATDLSHISQRKVLRNPNIENLGNGLDSTQS